jgi:hypothetical protein
LEHLKEWRKQHKLAMVAWHKGDKEKALDIWMKADGNLDNSMKKAGEAK